ncbi:MULTISPECIES: PGF-CTERM sorting domain-containing protein [unclassified Haladaptatus]|uniref:PGF-CTERM sorting domain-containing protein n=1 Tax=unclassified Haladaptatus TaxID=2622732 RepID=UPI00209C0A69|nr:MULTISPECIES: PGF-CTERM sorting domain-containing protein [unclassified Haladaptatus]MCO8243199.1 PGF-CTERM sorting domain-containing protein [Haladaptatus sp. AB643]MCO8252911.1 PGF-CTERM sorting domain-containing protein [Haladaptatus sp. AB618]
MRFKHALAVALVLTVCAVPLTVSAGTPVDDVSPVQLAQSSTTTETMHNGTMDDGMHDNMTTTTDEMGNDSMDDGMHNGSDNMTTTHEMDDGTMTDDNMTDDEMTDTTDDNMSDDNMSDTTTDDTMNDGESGGSGNSLPGFGIGVALVALVAGALYIARNR